MTNIKTFCSILTFVAVVSGISSASYGATRDPLASVPDCATGQALAVTDSGWLDDDSGRHVADFHDLMSDDHLRGVPDHVWHSADYASRHVGVCRTIDNLHYFVK
jgi:hypothetical protein